MPTAHLICGPTAAGKTTYAIALAASVRAVRFSVEDWLVTLFAADGPQRLDLEWRLARADRCEKQIWAVASQVLTAGTSVVLDIGLSRADDRDRWRGEVAGTIAESKLHYLDVSRLVRLFRVSKRRLSAPSVHPFDMDDRTFDQMEARFEPPTDDELYGAMIVCEE